jgi:hypothetical protein
MVQVEVSKANQKEGPTSGVPTQEKTAKAPVPVEVADSNVILCIDDDRVNEEEPRLDDAPSGAALIPGFPWGPGLYPPEGTTSNDVTFVPGSFDIV